MKKIHDLMSLKGRTVLITGASGHLGSATAQALGDLGANLILVDCASERLCETYDLVRQTTGIKVHALTADLENEMSIADILRSIEESGGHLDVLINNAAFVGSSQLEGWAVPFAAQSMAVWRRALEVNLTAIAALSQACLPMLKASGHGSIINVGSIYGLVGPDWDLYEGTGMGNPAAYAASKGGLLQLTRWLATTLAPEIRVNAISPGGIERSQPETFQKKYIARTPLRRMATEEDLIGAMAYLASDLSAYVTGQNLVVDGGWSSW